MGFVNEAGLKRSIKEKNFSNLYLFIGNEAFLKQSYVNLIVSKNVNESFRDFNFHSFEGSETDFDEIAACCDSMPMMSERTVTLVHDMELNKADLTKEGKLYQLISDLPETSILIFWMDTLEYDKKDKNFLSVCSMFQKFGSVVQLDKKNTADIMKLLISGAKKRGALLTPENAKYLVSVSGDDLNVLYNELEKLSLFVTDGEITKKHIDTVCIKSTEATSFALADALVAGNFEKAYFCLDTLYTKKTDPILILGAIISSYVDMYRVKVSVSNGEAVTEIGKYFNYKNKEFRLENAGRSASRLSVPKLRKALELLSQADEKLKLNYEESKTRLILEELMVRLMLI